MSFDLHFSIQGSEPEPYLVRLGVEQGRVVADCSCRFGRTQAGKLSLCKHRRAVLQGDAKLLGFSVAATKSLNAWLGRNQTAVDALLGRRATPRVAGWIFRSMSSHRSGAWEASIPEHVRPGFRSM